MRHGQTTGDVENRYGGDYDDHLTDLGKRQSAELAEKLKDKGIQIIFVSPRTRAQETAKILSETLEVTSKTIEDIRERNAYGVLTGMTTQEAKAKYPQFVEKVKNYQETVEGAEPYVLFKKRIISAFARITKEPYESVAVVTHSGPIRCLFREVLTHNELESLGDCAFFTLRSEDGKISLE